MTSNHSMMCAAGRVYWGFGFSRRGRRPYFSPDKLSTDSEGTQEPPQED